jgi:hypothetical protein
MFDYLHGTIAKQISPINSGDAGANFNALAMRTQGCVLRSDRESSAEIELKNGALHEGPSECRLVAPLRHANCSEQCLSSGVKRKAFARFECFAF